MSGCVRMAVAVWAGLVSMASGARASELEASGQRALERDSRAIAPSTRWLQYATPEEAGFSSTALADARAFAESIGSASVFVVWRGRALVAWGEVERPLECHSVRKSLVNALYGIHVASGKIDLDVTLGDLGIDDVPPLTDAEKLARVRDLIRARSGIYHAAAKEPLDMKADRPPRGSRSPGEAFFYNNWDFNALGAIFERRTGQRVFDAFRDLVAKPIGMEDFRMEDTAYELEPSSSRIPAYSLHISARDLARFGQLYLQNGSWNGTSIVPAEWIRESTSVVSETGGPGKYGYLWWVYAAGSFDSDPKFRELDRHDMFCAKGTGGQFALVVPDAELVFVHNADTWNGREVRGPNLWQLVERVLEARTGEPKAEPKTAPLAPVRFANATPAPEARTTIDITPSELAEYAGDYVQSGENAQRATLHVYEGRPFALVHGVTEMELRAQAKDRFFGLHENVVLAFERGADGHVVGVTVTHQARPMRFRRVE